MPDLTDILGYEFKHASLIREALTHPSVGYEDHKATISNQRLEFLGDAVLQLTLSELLYRLYPKAQEGTLTQIRALLVSTKSLADVARHMDLGPQLKMGRCEEAAGGRDRDNSLADAFEAILAAIYLDGGMDAAKSFVTRIFAQRIASSDPAAISANPKGRLQELVQDKTDELPIYKVTNSTGPDHNKVFTANVSWRGVALGQGIARNKKDAEAQAASQALGSPVLKKLLAELK
jgi:ribonuclease III